MWSHVIGLAISVYTFSWMRSDHVLENVIDTIKIASRLYYYIHSLVYHYISYYQQITLTCVNNKTVFILQYSFFLYVWIHTYQISTVRRKIIAQHLKRYVTTFSYPKSDHNFHFCFDTYLAYILFIILCSNFPLTLKTGMCWNLLQFYSQLNQIDSRHNIISLLI